ncbi:putative subtilisin-like protease precursor, partial [Neoconidiobolus thromboides FSU 785]
GSYIINLKKELRSSIELHLNKVQQLFIERSFNNSINKIYHSIGGAYHAKFSDSVLQKVRNFEDVDYIEADSRVSIQSTQTNAPWGLARTSQRQFVDRSKYDYDGDGNGVNVYIIDSGIYINHPEFEGRAKWGANFVSGSPDNDEQGHGTHCAGTVGSVNYGISKKANLIAVKVLDKNGDGTWSNIIAGIDWVIKNKSGKYANVISMSISGGYSKSCNDAIDSAVSSGIFSVIAAGNNNDDSCKHSPGSSSSAFTVAASDQNDNKASFSNHGECVSIIAPGVDILSTWNNGSTYTMSGTSMATPHVAGLAAYFYSKGTYTIEQMKNHLQSIATKGYVKGFSNSTKNNLIYNGLK